MCSSRRMCTFEAQEAPSSSRMVFFISSLCSQRFALPGCVHDGKAAAVTYIGIPYNPWQQRKHVKVLLRSGGDDSGRWRNRSLVPDPRVPPCRSQRMVGSFAWMPSWKEVRRWTRPAWLEIAWLGLGSSDGVNILRHGVA